jgi:hypothetical protein
MSHDALGAHALDEPGISDRLRVRPLQGCVGFGSQFRRRSIDATSGRRYCARVELIMLITSSSLAMLVILGALSARAGGASVVMGALRATFWGGLAMAVTAGIGWQLCERCVASLTTCDGRKHLDQF